MLWMAIFYSFAVLPTGSLSLDPELMKNSTNLTESPPICTVTIANETVDCSLRFNDICCTEGGTLTPYPYIKKHDTAYISFPLLHKSSHVFYLTKSCKSDYSYCVTIQITVPENKLAELESRDLTAVAKISKLLSGLNYGLFLGAKHALPSGLHVQNEQHLRAGCDPLINSSMNQHVRRDTLMLATIPSPYLNDDLTAELIESTCNFSCLEGRPQNCKWQIVEAKKWPQLSERLIFNTKLIPGSYYCVLVRHTKRLNCAIALVTFQHQEESSSEETITDADPFCLLPGVVVSICILFASLCFFCITALFWSFLRGRGVSWTCWCRYSSQSPMPTICQAIPPGDSSGSIRHDAISKKPAPPLRILFLYSRDSKELCDCMKALGRILQLSTHAEILDPLNDLWGGETEESARLLWHREGGVSKWLYAHLGFDCSILLLMSPGGKLRQNALDKLEKVVFDPPNMLDDIFLLGLDYIRVQRASNYTNVFQISLESIGCTGETYNVGVPLAKYILPLRLQQLIGTLQRDNGRIVQNGLAEGSVYSQDRIEHDKAVMRFENALSSLKMLHMKDSQYMDRTIVSLTMYSALVTLPKCEHDRQLCTGRCQA